MGLLVGQDAVLDRHHSSGLLRSDFVSSRPARAAGRGGEPREFALRNGIRVANHNGLDATPLAKQPHLTWFDTQNGRRLCCGIVSHRLTPDRIGFVVDSVIVVGQDAGVLVVERQDVSGKSVRQTAEVVSAVDHAEAERAWATMAFSGEEGKYTAAPTNDAEPEGGGGGGFTALPPGGSTWAESPPESTPTSACEPITAIDLMLAPTSGPRRCRPRRWTGQGPRGHRHRPGCRIRGIPPHAPG
jgi:hypothetical protein